MSNLKTVVLIDAENLEIEARNTYGGKFHYEKLMQELSSHNVSRTLYFKPEDKLTKGWAQVLTDWGYEVKVTAKNSDSWLIITAVTLASKCDQIVIMGGDLDYAPLVCYLQSKGVKAIVWMWPECTSKVLKEITDVYKPLTAEYLLSKTNNLISLTANRR